MIPEALIIVAWMPFIAAVLSKKSFNDNVYFHTRLIGFLMVLIAIIVFCVERITT